MRFLPVAVAIIWCGTSNKTQGFKNCAGLIYHSQAAKSSKNLDFWRFFLRNLGGLRADEIDPNYGRGERIRTSDLSVPNRAHYQAVLRPEGPYW